MKKTLQKHAKVTSKGQITVPLDVRRALGIRAGDRLLFESDERGMRVRKLRRESPFAKYSGIGNPGIPAGIDGINRWLRELRGHDDRD
jgi:AbrB family looped-hinge helix DNA binding protein